MSVSICLLKNHNFYEIETSHPDYSDTTLADIITPVNQIVNLNIVLEERPGCQYTIGDVNGDSTYNGLDIVYGVNFIHGGLLPMFECDCYPHNIWFVSGDVNADCVYNGLDLSYGVMFFNNIIIIKFVLFRDFGYKEK